MASPYSLLLKLVYLKAAWSAFAELRKQSRPPPPFVIFGFVDRTLSTVEETLAQQGNNLHELIRWSSCGNTSMAAQGNPWKEVNLGDDMDFINQLWPCIFGKLLQYNVTKGSPLHKKVCPWPLAEHVQGWQ